MDMSAVIKTSVNDGGTIVCAFSENITVPNLINPSKPIDINDYAISVILQPFFWAFIDTILQDNYLFVSRIPLSGFLDIDDRPTVMGQITSSFVNPSHGNTVSLACFTESSLRGYLASFYAVSENMSIEAVTALTAMINTTPMDQLGGALSRFLTNLTGGGAEFTITIIKDPQLTISRLTESDFDVVSNNWFGSLTTPFFDAFDLIKERIVRQESSLNSAGYAPAVYTDNGGDGSNDTIVFSGEYGFSERYQSNV